MGVHKRQREMEEVQGQFVKKSSCIFLVLIALLMGAFIGNTITMVYIGQQGTSQNRQASVGTPSAQQPEPHVADPNALAALEAETATNPTSAEAWVKLGNFCFDHDLSDKAVIAYEHALELSPMKIGVWSDLGVMYRRTKQFDKAIFAFEQAAALDPNHVVSRFNMGIVYLHDLNDKVGALKIWKEILVLDPEAKSPNGQPLSQMVRDLENNS